MFGFEYSPHMTDEVNIDVALRNMAQALVKMNREIEKLGSSAGAVSRSLYPGDASRNFEIFIRSAARNNPGLPLERALAQFDSQPISTSLHGKSMAECGRWVLTQASILELMATGKKINAIKEVRATTGLGLKDAKEAVEWAQMQIDSGWVSEEEAKRLEEEEQMAIQSILKGTGS